jgi:hypothetical protein
MNYPLFLSYQGATIGNGFVAEVSGRGRVLATIETEGVWMYGVNPGAIAADGGSLDEAHAQLRETIRLVLIDYAKEAKDFAEFRTRVQTFFNQTDDDSVAEWDQAVVSIQERDGPDFNLPRVSATSSVYICVDEKRTEQLSATMNVPAMNLPPPADHAANLQLAKAA